ncbi:single-stranded-DNA-specific exonuclease RecJ [Longibacter salinarum]|uniref:Single-stranded-DNA-specific exonuclease RecJ n=1 Tax=Longibacter salinarum TaxID=1850348 RepID=A0A2A8CWA9_9BACT|nr:single-stranded-DNA-specific exonuclease RecJ [Longibacter salinarum]PEN13029.1 single-stranded-DNA-specific exonuclease RecJ [Longibacter salinarum]
MTYRWILRSVDDPNVISDLQKELNGLPEALARALALRNVSSFDEARHFFRADREALHDPFLMQDMEAAADRVAEAIESDDPVLVYGDYDVDGTTASALMADFLRSQGVDAHVFIPDRYEDGYGLGSRGLDRAREIGATLVIALDCGITAMEEAAYARELGLDLIICDHHTPKATLPEAVAILDPKRDDCEYPFKELSGCGVGFKLVQATLDRLGQPADDAFRYLDLLAVSTASDIVPLYGENRVLMAEGLRVLQEKDEVRPGLRAMAQTADLDLADVTSTGKIVFTIGPRINAAGRMAQADLAVDLMLAPDVETALPMARELETLNRERREINDRIEKEAIELAERQITSRTPHGLVLYNPEWHLGIIGIVASSVVEHFHKPAILLARNGAEVKGSARSISGVNVYDALSDCEDVLTQFGGHDYAAGMSLPEDQVDAFRDAFDEAVGKRITAEMLTPAIKVDASMPLDVVGEHRGRFWAVLKQFGPHGPANATPVFHSGNLVLDGKPRTVGRGGNHLKFRVREADSDSRQSYDVIGFGMGNKLDVVRESYDSGEPIELLYSVEENTWNGRTTLQLKCRDVRLESSERVLQKESA